MSYSGVRSDATDAGQPQRDEYEAAGGTRSSDYKYTPKTKPDGA